jgi:hypothetical protein
LPKITTIESAVLNARKERMDKTQKECGHIILQGLTAIIALFQLAKDRIAHKDHWRRSV